MKKKSQLKAGWSLAEKLKIFSFAKFACDSTELFGSEARTVELLAEVRQGRATEDRQNLKVRNLPRKLRSYKLQANNGFTLIELLVSMAVLAIVAGVGVTIFLSVTQSYAKAGIINNLRYEGSRLIEEMSRVIRSGTNLEAATSSTLTVTIERESLEFSQNGNCETVVFQLESAGGYNDRIRKSLLDCDGTAVGAGVIVDDDLVTGVNVSGLSFTVTDGGTIRPDRVDISLTLEQGLSAPKRKEYTADVTLRNSVTTRRY